MKIVIPKEYRSKFADGKAYISIFPWRCLLVTNERMQNELIRRLKAGIPKRDRLYGVFRLYKASIREAKLKKDGTVMCPTCPKWFMGQFGKGKPQYKKGDWGIVVMGKGGKWYR